MKSKVIIVKTIGVAVSVTLAAIFVHAYSIMQANWLQYGLKLDVTALPYPAMFFHACSLLGYILPAAALATLFIKNPPRDEGLPGADAALWSIGIVALAWAFACVLAWQLPLYYPVANIR